MRMEERGEGGKGRVEIVWKTGGGEGVVGGGRDGGRGGYIHTLWSPTHVCFAIMLYIQPRGLCGEWAVGAGMRVGEEEREGAQNSSLQEISRRYAPLCPQTRQLATLFCDMQQVRRCPVSSYSV